MATRNLEPFISNISNCYVVGVIQRKCEFPVNCPAIVEGHYSCLQSGVFRGSVAKLQGF